MAKDISSFREKIDDIDDRMLELLNERAGYAREIAESKAEKNAPVYVPRREIEIINRLITNNKGPMNKEGVEAVFREVISACRALEHQLVISYLGPAGTFTHEAAHKNSAILLSICLLGILQKFSSMSRMVTVIMVWLPLRIPLKGLSIQPWICCLNRTFIYAVKYISIYPITFLPTARWKKLKEFILIPRGLHNAGFGSGRTFPMLKPWKFLQLPRELRWHQKRKNPQPLEA